MLAPIATLAFLAMLWLALVATANSLERGLGKITAALRGRSMLASAVNIPPVAIRFSPRSPAVRTARAQPRLRAAA